MHRSKWPIADSVSIRNSHGVMVARVPSGSAARLNQFLRNTMITFRVAETKHDYGWCVAIRTLVFEVEQHVDIGLEVDQHEDTCRHLVGIDDRIPFAAARWRIYKPGVAKIERVAVLKAWRGRNLGTALMDAVISDIKSAGPNFKILRIEAQDYTIPFYEKMGFVVLGAGFLEANIPHHAMEKSI